MRFAFADPPYLGCGKLYAQHHPEAHIWDDPETHRQMVARLVGEYPDGWAMSLSSTTLHTILPMCPADVRVAAWVKPFAAFKRNVRNAYTWEPVILRGGRVSSKDGAPVTRDHLAEPIQMKAGLTGAKPQRFNRWVLDMLGFIDDEDTLDDLFPGTAGMARTLESPPLNLALSDEHDAQRRAARRMARQSDACMDHRDAQVDCPNCITAAEGEAS